jgi:hypothetical protein
MSTLSKVTVQLQSVDREEAFVPRLSSRLSGERALPAQRKPAWLTTTRGCRLCRESALPGPG